MTTSVQLAHLRCEHLTNPLGIDVLQPRLSWILECTSRGQCQTAYQVLVATSLEQLADNRGDSRDGKADLNQVALELIHEHQASLQVALHVVDGNQNDQQTLCTSVGTHIEQLRAVGIAMLVKDSAGYSDTALQAHEEAGLTWISRVPATLVLTTRAHTLSVGTS